MTGSKRSTGLAGGPPSALVTLDGRVGSAATQPVFAGVLAVLLATGWVANHFAALMPVIIDSQHLSVATIDAVFGIYALGLVPGLLIGGRASDALGRQAVAWSGSTLAVLGTVAMLLSQHADVLLAGRLIVGVGVGLAMTAGTAWASDLKGPPRRGHGRNRVDGRLRGRPFRGRSDRRGELIRGSSVLRDRRGHSRRGDAGRGRGGPPHIGNRVRCRARHGAIHVGAAEQHASAE